MPSQRRRAEVAYNRYLPNGIEPIEHPAGMITYTGTDPDSGGEYAFAHERKTETNMHRPLPHVGTLVDTPHRYDNKKRCSICKALKPLDQFNKHPRHLDGLQSYCKQCHALAERANRKIRKWKDSPPKKRKS